MSLLSIYSGDTLPYSNKLLRIVKSINTASCQALTKTAILKRLRACLYVLSRLLACSFVSPKQNPQIIKRLTKSTKAKKPSKNINYVVQHLANYLLMIIPSLNKSLKLQLIRNIPILVAHSKWSLWVCWQLNRGYLLPNLWLLHGCLKSLL